MTPEELYRDFIADPENEGAARKIIDLSRRLGREEDLPACYAELVVSN
jgi:hypothetical protein